MHKIPINKIQKKIFKQKGFPTGPFNTCLTCPCGKTGGGGACCDIGVYVDKESYNLIMKHKKGLEKVMGMDIKKCFKGQWLKDADFLGGTAIETRNRNGYCIFRARSGQGCELVNFVLKHKLPKRMIPSACRLYPITWDNNCLFLEKIKKNCVCVDKKNKTKKSIYESQKKELEDIFSFS